MEGIVAYIGCLGQAPEPSERRASIESEFVRHDESL